MTSKERHVLEKLKDLLSLHKVELAIETKVEIPDEGDPCVTTRVRIESTNETDGVDIILSGHTEWIDIKRTDEDTRFAVILNTRKLHQALQK